MAREKDPAEVVETIAQSIRVSQRRARRVRAHRFKELFGYQALSAQRRERIERLMADAGIVVRPSLAEAGRDDWLVMSIPAQTEVREAHPDPRPSAEWFQHMKSVRPDTEREVEMHFASPLFRELGYREEQEAAGFGIQVYQGSRRPQRVEADLLYFAGERHDVDGGQPLVIVECKRLIKDLKAAAGQVRSYALWVLPAYYVITDAQTVSVWDFQGAIAPDIEVLRLNQGELDGRFDDLYARLNPNAASLARQNKIGRLEASR
jgi:type I restriction and modification enzyme subunit R-like protein